MMEVEFTFDVFLSHSSIDKPVVRELAQRLKIDGMRVWFDEWEIRPGDSVPAKIEEGLEHSRTLILCMSANAFGSDWTQLEAGTFRFRDPLNHQRRFIPLRLDDAPIKGSLAQFLYINWYPANSEKEYARLLETCYNPENWSPSPKIENAAESHSNSKSYVIEPYQVDSSAFDPDEYVQNLRRMLASLQKTRSFVDPNRTAISIVARRLRHDGHVDAGLPNMRFQVQAKKLSVDELQQKYGGAELTYEDYLQLVIASKESSKIDDVVEYLTHMRAGWAVQILGGPGIGKSFILRDACKAWTERGDLCLPFWIELRDAPPDGFQSVVQVLEFIALSLQQCSIQAYMDEHILALDLYPEDIDRELAT
jgi:hypothetical protein